MKTLKITAITTLLLTISILSAAVCSSLTITEYEVGDVYKESPYYKAVTELQLTGDQRYDVISIALSQLGYHTGDSDDEMDGKNIRGWNGFVEYNRIYGKVDNDQGNGISYGYYWCACFVSWCMRQAGVPTSMVPSKSACRHILSHLDSNGLYVKATSGYVPTCGDLIFFRGADSSRVTHIGFVLGTKNNMVYTVEGNANDHVTTKAYPINDTYIEGYGKVEYDTIEGMSYDFALAATDELYYYKHTNPTELNVHSEAGVNNEVIYTFPPNTVFEIYQIKSSWVKVNTPNGYGWCNVSDVDHIMPTPAYAIKYYLEGGVGGCLDQVSDEGESITISKNAPVRTGYKFKGWAEAPNGAVKYHPGDIYNGKSGDSLKELFAIWEADTYNVKYMDEEGNTLAEHTVKHGEKIPYAAAPEKPSDETYRYKFTGWSPAIPPIALGNAVYTPVYKAEKLVPDTTTVEETTKAPETDPPVTDPPSTEPPVSGTPPVKDTAAVTTTDEITDEITEDTETVITESTEITDSDIITENITQTTDPDEVTYAQTEAVTHPATDVPTVTDITDTSTNADDNKKNTTPLVIAASVLAAAAVITAGVIFAIKIKNS